jgi:hypothetical protein
MPEWHVFYWQIVGLMIAMVPLKALTLLPSLRHARGWIQLAASALGVMILVVMVQVRSLFVALPGTSLTNLSSLEGVNAGIAFGFKIALAFAVVKFGWDVWKEISARQHRQRAHFAAVL